MANLKENKSLALIIDDDSQIHNYIRTTLSQFRNLDIVSTTNAHDGVTKFAKHRPDLVFLDINLPDKDGLSLLQELLNLNEASKIVMISSDSTVENVKSAINMGAKGFVVKPFTMRKIIDLAKHLLEK